jgi:predicted Zn-dependent protease
MSRIGLACWLMFAVGGVSQAQLVVAPVRASQLPSLGDGSELPAASERRLGDRIAVSIFRDPDYIDDPVLGDYVQSIWQPLMGAARARGELSNELEERFAWNVMLVRDRSVNAFALPGGYLGVHTGLIAVVSSADELAAVMAHELSHVTQRHISRLMSQQQRQMPWVIGAMILGALAASKSPEAANVAIVGGQALAVQGQLNFSRDMEREADRVGFGVMVDAGFQANGVGGMFEKLQQASRLNDNGRTKLSKRGSQQRASAQHDGCACAGAGQSRRRRAAPHAGRWPACAAGCDHWACVDAGLGRELVRWRFGRQSRARSWRRAGFGRTPENLGADGARSQQHC